MQSACEMVFNVWQVHYQALRCSSMRYVHFYDVGDRFIGFWDLRVQLIGVCTHFWILEMHWQTSRCNSKGFIYIFDATSPIDPLDKIGRHQSAVIWGLYTILEVARWGQCIDGLNTHRECCWMGSVHAFGCREMRKVFLFVPRCTPMRSFHI